MRRDVQGILLILVGGAILRIALTDTFLNYVKAVMQPWLIVSGAMLVLLGLLALIDTLRHRADHSHAPRSTWMLLLPVLAIFLIAPGPLGAYSAERSTTNGTQQASAKAPPLPAGDPVEISLSSYVARAVWDDGTTLQGRNVSMTGFVTPDPQGGWMLTRLTMSCCAADALASKVKTVDTADLPANTWVTVVGHWVPGGGTKSDSAVPLIAVTSLEEIPQPKNPYE